MSAAEIPVFNNVKVKSASLSKKYLRTPSFCNPNVISKKKDKKHKIYTNLTY